MPGLIKGRILRGNKLGLELFADIGKAPGPIFFKKKHYF